MFLDGVLSEDDVALLQDAIARATRMAAKQNIEIDPHVAAFHLCELLLGGERDAQKMRRPWSVMRFGGPCISRADIAEPRNARTGRQFKQPTGADTPHQQCDSMFVLERGKANVLRHGEDHLIQTLREGDCLGRWQ
jgi:hypothetical protein